MIQGSGYVEYFEGLKSNAFFGKNALVNRFVQLADGGEVDFLSVLRECVSHFFDVEWLVDFNSKLGALAYETLKPVFHGLHTSARNHDVEAWHANMDMLLEYSFLEWVVLYLHATPLLQETVFTLPEKRYTIHSIDLTGISHRMSQFSGGSDCECVVSRSTGKGNTEVFTLEDIYLDYMYGDLPEAKRVEQLHHIFDWVLKIQHLKNQVLTNPLVVKGLSSEVGLSDQSMLIVFSPDETLMRKAIESKGGEKQWISFCQDSVAAHHGYAFFEIAGKLFHILKVKFSGPQDSRIIFKK